MKWSIIIALAIGIFGFIPGMGIPGALVLTTGEALSGLFGYHFYCLEGDRAWPAAILTTWVWPIWIPISYYLCFRLFKTESKRQRWLTFVVALFVSMLVTSAGIELFAQIEGCDPHHLRSLFKGILFGIA